jgi:hypothetical protein
MLLVNQGSHLLENLLLVHAVILSQAQRCGVAVV